MIKAKKKFGQNFLTDQSVIKEILNHLKPSAHDKILEIGPGMGAITIPLLNKLNHISVIEIDADMINYLQKKIPEEKINIINHDVLSINNKDWEVYDRIIGNLPYYIYLLYELLPQGVLSQEEHLKLQQKCVCILLH